MKVKFALFPGALMLYTVICPVRKESNSRRIMQLKGAYLTKVN